MTSVVYKTYEEGDKRNLNPEVACMKDQEQCVICRRFFEQAETLVQIPQCKHIFHTKCLKRWLVEWQKCPTCSRPIIKA
jgi:hypothetical protein